MREKVKPERDKNNRETYRKYWWQFGEKRRELLTALSRLKRCLVTARVSKHLCFSFQPTDRVFHGMLFAFMFDRMHYFACLQSRVHECWARLQSSTMEDRLLYSATDAFETFPLPADVGLDSIGNVLHDARATYMVATNQGLTATYNQLKDPDCAPDRPEALAAICHLRQLHEDLDRAVLAAYGWSDIPVPPFCPATDADRAAVSLFEDAVIDRLFALNAERAAEEAKTSGTVRPDAKRESKPAKPRQSRIHMNQTSMLNGAPREAEVIPLPLARPQPRSVPAIALRPDMSTVTPGAWARPRSDHKGEAAAALAAVLKMYGQPEDCRQMRLATLLCLEAQLLVPILEASERKEWARAVGTEATSAVASSIDETTQHWGAAVSALRSRSRLIEDLQGSTWAPGTGLDGIDTRGWPDGRAAFVVHVLGRVTISSSLDAVILKFPNAVRELVNRAA